MRLRTGAFRAMRRLIFLTAAIFFIMPFSGYSLDFFTGLVELSTSLRVPRNPLNDEMNPILEGHIAFDGQINAGDLVYGRIALHAVTQEDPNDKIGQSDVADSGFFPGAVTGKGYAPAKFTLDEVSLTLKQRLKTMIHYFSFFVGSFESPGTTTYTSRYLGVAPFTSLLTQTYFGDIGSSFYDQSGMGFSYTMRFKTPVVFSLQLASAEKILYASNYTDDVEWLDALKQVEKPIGVPHMSPGIRLAGAFPMLVFDLAFNVVIPFKETTEQTKAVLRTGFGFQGGLSFFMGNRFSQSMLLQVGLTEFYTDEKFKLNNLYLLLEGRLVDIMPVQIHLTAFALPIEKASEMFFIREPFGANLAILSNDFYSRTAGRSNTLGVNLTFSARNRGRIPSNLAMLIAIDQTLAEKPEYQVLDMDSLGKVPINLETISLYIAPFVGVNLFSGKFNIGARLDLLHLDSWRDTFALRLSYRAAF
ncbi:MAG: hypothetical protein Ta2A_05140 [Treponemataceae bacterium]|nr:MAG: hypothetical protein Ta2A_05140 [Treponemataceae bacterium]